MLFFLFFWISNPLINIVLFKESHVNIDLDCEMFKEAIIKDFVIN